MSDAFFAAAARLAKPTLAWTVDSPEGLHRGLEVGVTAVVSNRPLALRSVLLDWRDRCSERPRRRRRLRQGGRIPRRWPSQRGGGRGGGSGDQGAALPAGE